jgi:hypothetical protein
VRVRGSLPAIPEVASSVQDDEQTWRLLLSDGAAPSEILASLVRAGAVIERFEPMLAPMEDIFLRVVRKKESPSYQ